MTVDSFSGDLYFSADSAVYKYDISNNKIELVAGEGGTSGDTDGTLVESRFNRINVSHSVHVRLGMMLPEVS